MNLVLIGINFRSAPLEVRETMAFKKSFLPRMLRCMKRLVPEAEFVLLSTCNRTELYAAGLLTVEDKRSLHLLFAAGSTLWGRDNVERYHYQREDLRAVEHLFRVAASLDSMVVGEREIVGQVKDAYDLALQVRATGSVLNPLFQKAFKVAKQIQTETGIARGHVSVSSVAVDFAEKVFPHLADRTVLIVGSGQTAETTLQNLWERGVRHILVVNRSLDHGRALALKFGGTAATFDHLDEFLTRADIVITSTDAPHCVIHHRSTQKALVGRPDRPMFLIDIAVPRDIEPQVAQIPNVHLYNIDDLRDIAAQNLSRRTEAIEQAQAIVARQTAGFADWFRSQTTYHLLQQSGQSVTNLRTVGGGRV